MAYAIEGLIEQAYNESKKGGDADRASTLATLALAQSIERLTDTLQTHHPAQTHYQTD